jgi:hypothetical protein
VSSGFADRASSAVQSSYEDLRAQALTGGQGPGLAIFLHHGMREWMEICSSCMAVVAPLESASAEASRSPQRILPEMRSEIVSILANLFLEKRREATQ